ncbi:MAG: hypothetical protein ACO201_03765 [Rickettsiales bacterium]
MSNSVMKNQGNLDEEYLAEKSRDFKIFKKYYEVFCENSPQIKSDEKSLKKNFTSHKSKYGDGRDILKFHDFLKGNGDENSSKDPFFLAFREYCLFSQFRSNYNKTSKYSNSPIIPESELLLTFDSFRRGEYNIYYNNSPQKYNKNDVDRFLSDTLSQKEEKNFANPVFLAYNIIVSRYCPEELKEAEARAKEEAEARARENVVRVNKDLARREAEEKARREAEARAKKEAEARAKEEAEANANKTNFFDVSSNFIGAIVQSVAGHLGVAEKEAADLAASRDCPPSINLSGRLESRKQSQVETTREAKVRARENVDKDLARREKEVGEAVQRANDAEQKAKYAAYKARQIAQQIVNQNPEMRYANGDCPPSINLSGRLEHINKSQVETAREAKARAKEEAEANANKTNFFDVSNFIGAIVQSGAGHLGVAEKKAADLAASRDCPPSINPPRPLESRKQSQGKENSKESEPNSQNFQYHAPKFQDVWVRLFKFISRANGLDNTPTSNQLPEINKEPDNPIVPRVINNNETTPATKKKMKNTDSNMKLPAITTTPTGWVRFTKAPKTKGRRRFWDDPQPHQEKHPRQI